MTNAQKTPIARTLPLLTKRSAVSEIAKRWLALPAQVVSVQGAIVTVAFDVPGQTLPKTAMPIATSKYGRAPVQAGDWGVAFPASQYIGRASGLGSGNYPPAALQYNLSAMVWEPVGNANWSEGNPQDYVLTDATGASVVTLAPTGITLAFGGHSIVIDSSGVTIDGKAFLTHEHLPGTYTAPSGGGPVTGDSGAVV